jgi:hypothetical protein
MTRWSIPMLVATALMFAFALAHEPCCSPTVLTRGSR